MRTYGQNCALAKALDVIGDRWTLLIVRELMIRDCCRYTDLRNGLPGIATNLLTERLKDLEKAGLLTREAAPPPVATTLFRLTMRGKELELVRKCLQLGPRVGSFRPAPLRPACQAKDDHHPHECAHQAVHVPLPPILTPQAAPHPPVWPAVTAPQGQVPRLLHRGYTAGMPLHATLPQERTSAILAKPLGGSPLRRRLNPLSAW